MDTQRNIRAWRCCSVRRRRSFIAGEDDAEEEDIGFIHQRLAAIAADDRQRLGFVVPGLQRDGAVHLGDLLVHNRGQPPEHRPRLGIVALEAGQALQLPPGLRFGGVEGRQVDLVAGQQVAPLAAFGGPERVPEPDRRVAGIAHHEGVLEEAVRALAQPDGHADDDEQGEKPDGQEARGRPDDETAGYRHGGTPGPRLPGIGRKLNAAPRGLDAGNLARSEDSEPPDRGNAALRHGQRERVAADRCWNRGGALGMMPPSPSRRGFK